MPSLSEIQYMPNSEIVELYKASTEADVANGRKDIKFAVNNEASAVDIKRAHLAVKQAHKDGLTVLAEGI